MKPLRRSPSTLTLTSPTCQRANTASTDQKYEILPPSTFVVSFARFATAPLIPTLATFANQRVSSAPDQPRNETRPRSIVRVVPCSATSTAPSSLRGIEYVRTKSQPVPRGITASSTSRPAIPFTTSFTEPSPPTTTSSTAPPSTA